MLYPNIRITDYYETYNMAVQLFLEVEGVNGYSPAEWIDYHSINYIEKVYKPFKKTLLHEYIDYVYYFQIDYLLDKHFPREIIDSLRKIFNNYKIEDKELEKLNNEYDKYCEDDEYEYDGDGDSGEQIENLADRYFALFRNTLMPLVVDDIFTVLFQNKTFLRNFNTEIAGLISSLDAKDYPQYLNKDGVMNRCSYLPQWLKNGIFYRDKGRCQICGKDMSGLLNPVNDMGWM